MKYTTHPSNFVFLQERWPDLAELAKLAESYVFTDPDSCLVKIRVFTETIVDILYYELRLHPPLSTNLADKLTEHDFRRAIPRRIIDHLHCFRKAGNESAHRSSVKSSPARCNLLLRDLYLVSTWFVGTVTRTAQRLPPFEPIQQSLSFEELLAELKEKEKRIKQLEEEQANIRTAHPKEPVTASELREIKTYSTAVGESLGLYKSQSASDLLGHFVTESVATYEIACNEEGRKVRENQIAPIGKVELLGFENELDLALAHAIIGDIGREIPNSDWNQRLTTALETSPGDIRMQIAKFEKWLSENALLADTCKTELRECLSELREILTDIESADASLQRLCLAASASEEVDTKAESNREKQLVEPILDLLRLKAGLSSAELCFELNQLGYRVTGGVTRRALYEAKNLGLVSWSSKTTSWSLKERS